MTRAVSRPIPLPPPVTSATLPSSRPVIGVSPSLMSVEHPADGGGYQFGRPGGRPPVGVGWKVTVIVLLVVLRRSALAPASTTAKVKPTLVSAERVNSSPKVKTLSRSAGVLAMQGRWAV